MERGVRRRMRVRCRGANGTLHLLGCFGQPPRWIPVQSPPVIEISFRPKLLSTTNGVKPTTH